MNPILKRYNLWNQDLDFGVDRLFCYQQIVQLLTRKEIQVLSGIRRCGKTTLLRQCMRYLVDKEVNKNNILFVPCDDSRLAIKTIEDLDTLIEEFREGKGKDTVYIFLDEIQVVSKWESYLKSRYDEGAKIKFVISGSTASFFAKDVAVNLVGRYFFHKIQTLSFKEYLRLSTNGSLQTYLQWGGFPEVVKALSDDERIQILKSYLDTIILRDIVQRHNIREKSKVIKLIHALLSTVGGKIVVKRLAEQFTLDARSVERYIELAKDAFLLREVPFFSFSKRKNKHMLPKLYPNDIGFTRMLNNRFERGRSAEWAVLLVLEHATYWSTSDNEVDFVTKDLAIQMCLTDVIPAREREGLRSFAKIAKRKNTIISTSTTDNTISIEDFLNAYVISDGSENN